MKWMVSIYFVLQFVIPADVESQIVLSDSVINFGLVETGIFHEQNLEINNVSDKPVQVSNILFEEDEFTAEYAVNQIGPNSSINVTVKFFANQNIDYTDFMRIIVEDYSEPLVVRVEAQATYNDSYYSASRNKWDEELKSALHDIVDSHTSLGYTTARDYMYGSIDNENGWVECVYTGRRAQFDDRSGATANNFNCEHTWPQSFFNENEPMRSDIYHLYPTDIDANSRRGSYDFGVVQNASWSEGGSKLGTDKDGLTVFEPRDVHKGNVARTHFYFITRYSGQYVDYVNPGKMEDTFRDWTQSDPVDAAEEKRNEDIYALQNNRNPFIDHPEFVERIIRFFGAENRTSEPEIALSNERIELTNLGEAQDVVVAIGIINTGKAVLNISQIESSNPKFSVPVAGFGIPAESCQELHVGYSPSSGAFSDSTMIHITSNDSDEGTLSIPVVLHFTTTSLVVEEDMLPNAFNLMPNYPNPFNPGTTIRYSLKKTSGIELSVYTISGQKVATLFSGNQSAGVYAIHWDASGLSNGIYLCRLRGESGQSMTQKMILTK